ncbi:hypothetical protein CVT25_010492, partial [Psilocybe cyanescens]
EVEVGTAAIAPAPAPAAPLNYPLSSYTLRSSLRIVPRASLRDLLLEHVVVVAVAAFRDDTRHLPGKLRDLLLEHVVVVAVAAFVCSSFALYTFAFVVFVCVALLVVLSVSLDIQFGLPITMPVSMLLPHPPPHKRRTNTLPPRPIAHAQPPTWTAQVSSAARHPGPIFTLRVLRLRLCFRFLTTNLFLVLVFTLNLPNHHKMPVLPALRTRKLLLFLRAL